MIAFSEQRGGLQYYDPQEQAWTPRVLEMGPTRSGVAISEATAMKCSAVMACIRNVSEDIGKIPMQLFKRLDPRGKERVSNDTESLLTKEPNPEMSAFDFKITLQAHKMTWGNGFAEIEFDSNMRPIALWPLPPDRITVKRKKTTGEITYEIRPNYVDDPVILPAWKIFHLRGIGFDGLVGYSPIRMHAESIGITIAQERFAASFFGNGAYPGVVLTHPMRLTEEAEKRLKRSYEDGFRGADQAHRTFVLQEGMKIDKMTIAPNEAQFLESRQFSIEEIARMYRVPPHKIGHLERSTFSNIEQQNTEYVVDCLMSHAEAWEQEADRKLNLPDGQFFEHRFNALLKGDAVARGTFYGQMRVNGIMSTNDIRDLENLNPVPDGDVLLVQGAMISLENAVKAPPPGSKPPPEPPKPGEKVPPEPEKKSALLAKIAENHEIMLAEAVLRSLKIESERVLRAAKKPNFDAWKAEFYAEHAGHLLSNIRSIVYSLVACAVIPGIDAGAACLGIIQRHCEESQRVSAAGVEATVIGWNDTRAMRFAKEEIEKIVKETQK